LVFGNQRVDELVELALHHPVDFVKREVDAVIADAARPLGWQPSEDDDDAKHHRQSELGGRRMSRKSGM
jgi:hypothetical protein